MLAEKELKCFLEAFWEEWPDAVKDGPEDEKNQELEEYRLSSGGLIIQPIHKNKVSRSTWIALALLMLTVPLILYLSVQIFRGRKYLVFSLLIVFVAMISFFGTQF
ncbi:hypothetical protein [Marvinbryantia sp.]|uniref:hypothetical protein n=1 Tax=Marvinbryantia sp. TaxID=2496532 RepID=UPI0025F8A2BB|nr:hypothetical protein [uncultured Marvinbryantia sp.]